MPAGRPTLYNEELTSRICSRIATSSDSLRAICENENLPSPDTIYLWLTKYPEFSDQYARARQDQAQLLADQIVDIADQTQLGEIVTFKDDGKEERRVADMIEHRKLRIESRKWVAAKLLPKKYGDKPIQVGGIDGKPIEAAITVQFVKSQNGEDNS